MPTVLTRPRLLGGLVAATACATAMAAGPAVAAPPGPPPGRGAAPGYTLTDLGTLPGGTASFALGVGNDGDAVGTSHTGTGFRPQVAVRWRDGGIENLGTLPGSTFSRAFEVNSKGQGGRRGVHRFAGGVAGRAVGGRQHPARPRSRSGRLSVRPAKRRSSFDPLGVGSRGRHL